jgi:integrase
MAVAVSQPRVLFFTFGLTEAIGAPRPGNDRDIWPVTHLFRPSQGMNGSMLALPNTLQLIAARRAAGLPHFRLHDLRHFMATEMLAAGVPIATVSQRLSHARASTTLNV